MIATKQMDVRTNIKKYFDIMFNGEEVIVSRKGNKNVVIISETEYNALKKKNVDLCDSIKREIESEYR